MPPKKEKKDQFTGEQASDMMLDYLQQQNRPYSATDISTNLHNAVTKTTAAKLLKEMHENGEIEGRVSGKQVVYHAIQDSDDSASPEDLKVMDSETQDTKKEIAALKIELKELQASLSSLLAAPSSAALEASLLEAETHIGELEATLSPLRKGLLEPVDPKKAAAAEAEYVRIDKVFRQRRAQFKEFWGTMTESYEGDREELWEQIGLEEDC